MLTRISILAVLFAGFSLSAWSQTVELLASGQNGSFRGLSVVSDEIVWVSGNKGVVGRSIDGGETWNWTSVKGYEDRDFRDIEAFDEEAAVIMAVAAPAVILRTTDGGKNWKEVYRKEGKDMFLDAMDFRNNASGLVIGDPIGGRLFVARTNDGGRSWKELPPQNSPKLDSGGGGLQHD